MVHAESRMTAKGQVTIPAALRADLGLRPGDRIHFERDGEAIRLLPAPSSLRRGFGAVGPQSQPADDRLRREEFEQAVADDVMVER